MTKVVKTLEDSDVFMKGGALPLIPILLGTLGASSLTGRGLYKAGNGNKCSCGQEMYRAGEGKDLFRAGQEIKKKSLMPLHPLTNLEIQDYF